MRTFSQLFKSRTAAPAFASTIELGAYGERLAIAYLKQQGYRIVVTNYRAPIGRSRSGRQITGEIDIIAYDATGTLCFIEVKTRTSAAFAAPQAAVDLRKQRQIIRTAQVYRRVLQIHQEPQRYDVVSVLLADAEPEIVLLRSYFSAAPFQRSRWLNR
jgi:putative endonuclease